MVGFVNLYLHACDASSASLQGVGQTDKVLVHLLLQMNNSHLVSTMLLQIFSQQPTMAMLCGFLAAQETGAVERLYIILLQNVTLMEHLRVNFLIFRPRHFLLVPLFQQLLGRSKVCDVTIWDVAYFANKECQVLSFGKACQLAAVADADVHELPHMVSFE